MEKRTKERARCCTRINKLTYYCAVKEAVASYGTRGASVHMIYNFLNSTYPGVFTAEERRVWQKGVRSALAKHSVFIKMRLEGKLWYYGVRPLTEDELQQAKLRSVLGTAGNGIGAHAYADWRTIVRSSIEQFWQESTAAVGKKALRVKESIEPLGESTIFRLKQRFDCLTKQANRLGLYNSQSGSERLSRSEPQCAYTSVGIIRLIQSEEQNRC
ncbi:hypothetical protein PAPHI01_2278 [Pancytospora philotis]|nr:hypothetical protein PAPHI01_2278 [Pancytospora philotis]